MNKLARIFAILALTIGLSGFTPQLPAQTRTVTYVGAWSNATTYNLGEIVSSDGSTYISVVANNIGNTPASSPAQWSVVGGTPSGVAIPRAFTDVAIQAAINAAPSGGDVYLPAGTYHMCSGLPLLINKPIRLHGAGQRSTTLYVCSTLSRDTSAILVQAPTSTTLAGVEISDLQILPVSGNPGNSAISFDALSGGDVHSPYVHHISTGQFGGAAISGTSNSSADGTPCFGARIEQSLLVGGVSLLRAGDTLHIDHNVISGSGYALNVSFVPVASSLFFDHNNVTSSAGIHIGTSAVATHITDNEIETESGFTGSNGALVDVDGASSSLTQSVEVARNSFQVVGGIVANGIRVNYARNTDIDSNNFERGATGSYDILVTANAVNTSIGNNMWLSGGPFSKMLNDSGSATQFLALGGNGGPLINNNRPLQWVDETGAYRKVLNTYTDGTVSMYGYHGANLLWSNPSANTFYSPGGIAGAVLGGAPSAAPAEGAFWSVSALYANPISISNLPPATSYPGVVFGVTNSTAIAAEGQPCVGGGSTPALAFSNGTVWKCF